jgi:hypothetical protein
MPIDRGLVDQQLQALGEGSRWWNQRELRDLPTVLHADERILAISRGKLARVRWFRSTWLIVVTNTRLLALRSIGGRGWRQAEVNAGQIVRLALRVGPFRGRVLVVAGGFTYRLLVPRADAYKLMDALSSTVGPPPETFSPFGPARMFRRVIDHVLALPAVALNPGAPPEPPPPAPDNSALEQRVQFLEEQVELLQQQVDFLEQLLRQRQVGASAPEQPRSAE